MKEAGTYSTGQVAKMLGVHVRSLQNWERWGLIKVHRTSGGRRVYSEVDLELLRYIVKLQREQGLHLATIRAVLQAEGRLPQEQGEATPISGQRYAIGAVAEMLGLSVETLRGWERLGLVTPARYPSWYRAYSEEDIERLRYIVKLRGEGLDVRSLRRVLQLEGQLRQDEAGDTG